MASQSMLIILVGAVPEYHVEPFTEGVDGDVTQHSVKFTEDVSSIVTEVRDCHQCCASNKLGLSLLILSNRKLYFIKSGRTVYVIIVVSGKGST